MDTTQVPEFKLAKVGKRRERKKAGFFWLNGGAGAGSFTGATGGLGAFMGTTLAKVLVLGLLGTLGVGAYNVGMSMSGGKGAALQKPKLFDAKEKPANASAGTVVGPAPASGLAMVEGSLDGKTPEQRAAEAAAAEAAAKAEADKKAQEEADAKKAADEQAKKDAEDAAKAQAAAAATPQPDVAANEKKANFAKKFGALSSSLGDGHSGLAGGGGLFGGVGQSFSAMNMAKQQHGQAQAQAGQAAAKRVTAKSVALHGHSGRAFRQLVAANGQSRAARQSGTAETAAQSADSAFENNPGANQAITGGGAGIGGAGTGDGTPGANNANGSGSNGGGGPTGCGGDCSGGAPGANAGNATPWQDQITLAARLTVIASGLLMLGAIFSLLSNSAGIWTQGFKVLAGICGALAGVLGVVILGLGCAISGKGGPGTMYTITGGIITAAGALLAIDASKGFAGVAGISNNMIVFGSLFGGLLGGATNVGQAWGPNSGGATDGNRVANGWAKGTSGS